LRSDLLCGSFCYGNRENYIEKQKCGQSAVRSKQDE